MFHILSIRIFPECSPNLKKNLQTDKAFVFEKPIYEDFFAKNIALHAIVGKNGSGKSSLLELIFRMVNNLGYVLLYGIQRTGAYPLRYVYGIWANLDYEIDGKQYRLCCNDSSITWWKCAPNMNMASAKVIVSACVKVPHVTYRGGEYPKIDALEISIDDYRKLAEKLFYTIVVNYSMQAYVDQDYQDEDTEWENDMSISPHTVDKAWINALFHKNDGYMCPIVLNPYRNKGMVDMNREMRLTQQRVEALLIYYKRQKIDYIDGYSLSTINFTFNPDVVCNYFNNKGLAELIRQKSAKHDVMSITRDLSSSEKKFRIIIDMFKTVMKSTCNFQQEILKVFGINYALNMDDDLLAAELYLICKIINIAQTYPTYEKEKEDILLEDNSNFDYMEVLNPFPYLEYIAPMRRLAKKVKDQNGHIGLKVYRASQYVLLSQKKSKIGRRQAKLGDAFNLEEYEKHYWKLPPNSVERIIEMLPPSIFSYEIMLERKGKIEETKEYDRGNLIIPMRQMSSGERQFIFSTSTIIYHLQNLRSVQKPSPRYNSFNIILDEVEICFHPEYQRTFVHKLLTMLTRLKLNNSAYINIWIVTHSPFILSDFPAQNILYLREGDSMSPADVDNPFGANINDILRQSFFLDHGFMGEFSKYCILSLCHYLTSDKQLQECPSMYKKINWTPERAYRFIEQIGEPLLRTQMKMAYHNSKVVSREDRIEALERELKDLKNKE